MSPGTVSAKKEKEALLMFRKPTYKKSNIILKNLQYTNTSLQSVQHVQEILNSKEYLLQNGTFSVSI